MMTSIKNSILLLGEPRCGSSYFRWNLNQHLRTLLLSEPFHNQMAFVFRHFTPEEEIELREQGKHHGNESSEYFYHVWNLYKKRASDRNIRNIGCKVFYLMGNLQAVSCTSVEESLDRFDYVEKHKEHFNKIILLKRDPLEVFFSKIKAQVTKQWGMDSRYTQADYYPKFSDWTDLIRKRKWNVNGFRKKMILYAHGKKRWQDRIDKTFDCLTVNYDNINWKEISEYLGEPIVEIKEHLQIRYDYERWLKQNPEFEFMYNEIIRGI